MINRMDMRHLAFLARESRSRFEATLQSFLPGSWEGLSEASLSGSMTALKKELADSPELLQLFQVNLLGAFLLKKNRGPGRQLDWFRESLALSSVFEMTKWDDVLQGRWRSVPVLLTAEGAFTCWFLVGCLPGKNARDVVPGWAVPLFDHDALECIHESAAASRVLEDAGVWERLVCCPLLKATGRARVYGSSLGLPLTLGFVAVLKDQSIPVDVAATGTIDRTGAVGPVGDLEKKVTHAFSEGYKVFMYPEGNAPQGETRTGHEAVPVSNLKEAWMVSTLFSPGRRRELNLFTGMLNEPGTFAANCENIPVEWLMWIRKRETAERAVRSIEASGTLLNTLAGGLERCLERWDLERADAITGLFKGMDLTRTAMSAPSAVFRWLTQNLALANHRGKVKAAEVLVARIAPLTGQVAAVDLDLCATYYNHAFVTLHDAYRFEPELTGGLKKVLDVLERRFDVECMAGCRVNPTLGALYGSIAQNFGFCGPRFIDETLYYADLARKCFGEGESPEHREDNLRPFNYTTYALLDAGDPDKATGFLLSYLDLDSPDLIPEACDGFSLWEHAIVARLLAETEHPGVVSRYLAEALRIKQGLVKTAHPWQLWLYNLGRIALALGRRQEARALFDESLELCLSHEHGPTVHIMALLPLSGLDFLGECDRVRANLVGDRLRAEAQALNPKHFRLLVDEPDLKKILSRLREKPGALFPFSYR